MQNSLSRISKHHTYRCSYELINDFFVAFRCGCWTTAEIALAMTARSSRRLRRSPETRSILMWLKSRQKGAFETIELEQQERGGTACGFVKYYGIAA